MLYRPLAFTLLLASLSTQARAEGGSDGSGGNVLLSSEAEVNAAVADAEQELRSAIKRIGLTLSERSPEEFDKHYGQGSYEHLVNGLLPSRDLKILESIRSGEIRLAPQGPPCPSKDGHGDAAATGSGGKGTICLSRERLRRYPPASLRRELTALLLHEVGHLNGYNEEQAERLQTFANQHPALVVPEKDSLKNFERTADDLLERLPSLRTHLMLGSSDRRLCMEVARASQALNDAGPARFSLEKGKERTELPQTVLRNLAFADFLGLKDLHDACHADGAIDREKFIPKMEVYEELVGTAVSHLGSFVADGKRMGRLPYGVARDMLQFENSDLYRRAKGLPAALAQPAQGLHTVACGRAWFRRTPGGQIRPEESVSVSKFKKFYSSNAGSLYQEKLSPGDGTDIAITQQPGQTSVSLSLFSKDNGEETIIQGNEEEVAPGKNLTRGGVVSVDGDKKTYLPVGHLAEGIRTNINFFIPKPNGRYLGVRCDLSGKRNLVPFVPKNLNQGFDTSEDEAIAADVAGRLAVVLGDPGYFDADVSYCQDESRP